MVLLFDNEVLEIRINIFLAMFYEITIDYLSD